jgi:hypothetical protein
MRVVDASIKKSTLAEFASSFHQDFALIGVDPHEWGNEFIKRLSSAQRSALRDELREFLAAYPGKSAKGVRNAWVRLGATGWSRAIDLRKTINSWVKALE